MQLKSLIDLTPLVDIILILLFGFMIQARTLKEQTELKIDTATARADSLTRAVEQYNAIDTVYSQRFEKQQDTLNRQKEQLRKLLELAAEMFAVSDELVQEIIADSNDRLKERLRTHLENMQSQQDYLKELYAYSYLRSQFFILDVYLVGFDNRIRINGEETYASANTPDDVYTVLTERIESERLDRGGIPDDILIMLSFDNKATGAGFKNLQKGIERLSGSVYSGRIIPAEIGYVPYKPQQKQTTPTDGR